MSASTLIPNMLTVSSSRPQKPVRKMCGELVKRLQRISARDVLRLELSRRATTNVHERALKTSATFRCPLRVAEIFDARDSGYFLTPLKRSRNHRRSTTHSMRQQTSSSEHRRLRLLFASLQNCRNHRCQISPVRRPCTLQTYTEDFGCISLPWKSNRTLRCSISLLRRPQTSTHEHRHIGLFPLPVQSKIEIFGVRYLP